MYDSHRGMPGGKIALLHILHHYALLANVMLEDFKQTNNTALKTLGPGFS